MEQPTENNTSVDQPEQSLSSDNNSTTQVNPIQNDQIVEENNKETSSPRGSWWFFGSKSRSNSMISYSKEPSSVGSSSLSSSPQNPSHLNSRPKLRVKNLESEIIKKRLSLINFSDLSLSDPTKKLGSWDKPVSAETTFDPAQISQAEAHISSSASSMRSVQIAKKISQTFSKNDSHLVSQSLQESASSKQTLVSSSLPNNSSQIHDHIPSQDSITNPLPHPIENESSPMHKSSISIDHTKRSSWWIFGGGSSSSAPQTRADSPVSESSQDSSKRKRTDENQIKSDIPSNNESSDTLAPPTSSESVNETKTHPTAIGQLNNINETSKPIMNRDRPQSTHSWWNPFASSTTLEQSEPNEISRSINEVSNQDKHPVNINNQPLNENMEEMRSTWKLFFSSNTQENLQNSDPRLANANNHPKLIEDGQIKEVNVNSKGELEDPNLPISDQKNKRIIEPAISPNFVLPTLHLIDKNLTNTTNSQHSILQSAYNLLSYYTGVGSNTTEKPSSIRSIDPLELGNIVIIGVHGWFPHKIYSNILGEPTGTSERFCERMETAIRQYLYNHFGKELNDDQITQIPLSGAGKVEYRLNKLYSNLIGNTEWIQALKKAQLVLVAVHSQGTPVGTMIVSRLIRDGLLDTKTQSTCLLAMSGISHGPFPFLKENMIVKYFETEAARELFEFLDPESHVVKKYAKAMRTLLENGVKVTAVGSLMDQVVPLYSGTMHGFEHPSILRAIYIDHPNYQSDFLTNLIVYSILLRNHGISDHGLLVHLSESVAGSLYSGTPGHSTIYQELKVYSMAVQWLFEGPSFYDDSEHKFVFNKVLANEPFNPYYLPWIIRGLLEDELIKNDQYLKEELNEVMNQFNNWNPATKGLKDLKFKLSMLNKP